MTRDAWETDETGDATLQVAPDASVEIYADRGRLRTVFENLFRNAVEHSSGSPRSSSTREDALPGATDADVRADRPLMRGGDGRDGRDVIPDGTLMVTVDRHDDGFSVADDWPGIPVDDRESVFEYGYSTREEGTGLGLAIVDAIARAHGWSVAVTDGSDGGGARFVFSDVDPGASPGASVPTDD